MGRLKMDTITLESNQERIYEAGAGRGHGWLHVLPLAVPSREISDQGGRNPDLVFISHALGEIHLNLSFRAMPNTLRYCGFCLLSCL